MICHFRWLTPVINLLLATDTVDCVKLTPQWVVLHQIKITLVTIARWQLIMEGDRFVSALDLFVRPLNTITSAILNTNWFGCRFYLGIFYFILFY